MHIIIKKCSKCYEEKPLEEFLKNKSCKNGRAGVCSSCDNIYKKAYYEANKKRKQALANKRNQENKLKWIEAKGGKCEDCVGVFHPCAFDFHHITGKDMNPSRAIALGHEKAKKELDKCVLLCANCHRVRHFVEKEVLNVTE